MVVTGKMMIKWVVKKGEDRRIRSGHPWVFSNELMSSPKGTSPGELIELVDARGHFLARGYGNPHSLIAFRSVTWSEGEKDILGVEFFVHRLIRAWNIRMISGLNYSFRLCYGEADGLPGLVIDRYITHKGVVFAVQLLTAGMQRALSPILEEVLGIVLNRMKDLGVTQFDSNQMSIVVRNDVNIRKLEGLDIEEPRVLKGVVGVNLKQIAIAVDTLDGRDPVWMDANLEDGQKTGFFLDQRGNILQVLQFLKYSKSLFSEGQRIRVLDLCCYVGHWSSQLAQFLRERKIPAEFHLVDISKEALLFAEANVRRVCAPSDSVITHQMDVLSSLDQFESGQFNIVIADPPAFIKSRKDIPTGSHAYLKLNTQAFRVAASKSLVISCSCSGLMEEDNFRDILRKAQVRQSIRMPSVLTGAHSPDHPTIMSFPEGFYLKMIGHLKI